MKKTRLITMLSAFALTAAGALGLASLKEVKKAEVASAGNISSYSKIYRFTAPAEYWGNTVYIHIWGSSTASNNTEWPGIDISGEYSYNESSRKVYTYTTDVTDYKYIIFHNNSGWQTDNITIGSNTAWYLDGGNTPGTWTPSNQTYYLYDYKNLFGGNAKCYAWQSNGSLNNVNYPGSAMTKVQYGSGQLYSITLDPAFDEVKFGVGDSANTGDQWVNQHRGQIFCWWDAGDGDWSNDMDWVKAHDWIYQTMHMRDILATNRADTGACRGANGYYQKAKTAYSNYSPAIKTKMSENSLWSAAQARFVDWATACGETATWSGTTLTVNAKNNILFNTTNETNVALIIVLAVVAVTGIGGFAFIAKKRKSI